jgi:hypothetical protein
MGLTFATDLDEWHRWQRRRHVLRHAKHRLAPSRGGVEPYATVVHGSPHADIVVLVDAVHASMANAVLTPRALLPAERVITVWAPDLSPDTTTGTRVPLHELPRALGSAKTLLGCGEYTATGAPAWRWARDAKIPTFVSQHGALTPHAPPLPRDATLLAWTGADGEFWRSGRTDIRVDEVGSQLLWAAARSAPSRGSARDDSPLTYLGQGHAAELSRTRTVEAALRFCRRHGATYRPHPSERDRLSVFFLDALRRSGVRVDDGTTPLADLDGPVVSIFSTGVLEASARGRDAWVDFPRPPAWLGEFWQRYGMHRYGDAPTPPPRRPAIEPARRIAQVLERAASG